MIRLAFLGLVFSAGQVMGQSLSVPGLTPESELPPLPECVGAPYSKANCVRVLACIGEDGLWFDGQARGWDTGQVMGRHSDGSECEGIWSGNGPLGTGFSRLSCSDETTADVIYNTIDNETGTVMGTGRDSKGRQIRVWTGLLVLEFLTDEGDGLPKLPCGFEPILLS